MLEPEKECQVYWYIPIPVYTQELETEGLWVWGQPVLYSETLWKEGEAEKKVQ